MNDGSGGFDCADYTLGTYSDWEVPSISDWCSVGETLGVCPVENASDSLIDSSFYNPVVANAAGTAKWSDGDAFVGLISVFYWSATAAGGNDAWYVDLADGRVLATDISEHWRLWAVRDP